jgi:serine/threonine-protein kinase
MAQELKPNVEHYLVVRKTGYTEQTQQFRVAAGEVKPLPSVELAQLHVDTGFALTSTPEGAEISVDGNKLDQTTPARIADLEPGLHVIRLTRGTGFQPWETQVVLARGQVIDLPAAQLVAQSGTRVSAAERSEPKASSSSSGSSSGGSSSHRSRDRSSSHRSRDRAPAPAPTFASQAPRAPAPAPAPAQSFSAPKPSGNMGTLRINSRPWAQVIIDGRPIGNTPQLNIPLSPGSHKVKLVNPQLGMTKNITVDIKAGKPTTKIVELM